MAAEVRSDRVAQNSGPQAVHQHRAGAIASHCPVEMAIHFNRDVVGEYPVQVTPVGNRAGGRGRRDATLGLAAIARNNPPDRGTIDPPPQ